MSMYTISSLQSDSVQNVSVTEKVDVGRIAAQLALGRIVTSITANYTPCYQTELMFDVNIKRQGH